MIVFILTFVKIYFDAEKMADKRTRGPNYTKEEKLTLLTIITKYKYILENKKTDRVTWREKDDAWVEIHNEFNSISPAGLFRTTEALRKLYENIKKQTRKLVAEEKLALKKTGVGSEEIKSDETYTLALSILNNKSVFGLDNNFDSDAQNTNILNIIEDAEFVYDSTDITNDQHDDTRNDSVAVNYDNWKPSDLNQPICTNLQPTISVTEVLVGDEKSESLLSARLKKTRLKRRCLATKTSQSKDNLSDIYKEAGKAKEKYFRVLTEDLNKRREREEEEHVQKTEEYLLRRKSLLLDIKIKEEKLKSLSRANASNE